MQHLSSFIRRSERPPQSPNTREVKLSLNERIETLSGKDFVPFFVDAELIFILSLYDSYEHEDVKIVQNET